jgi:tetratricopeptide (TPR) repeat protein
MKKGSLPYLMIAILCASICLVLSACDKPKNEMPPPSPATRQQGTSGAPTPQGEAGTQPGTPGAPPSAQTGIVPIEAKQNLQQGLSYASIAKQNPTAADENYENALKEFSRAIEKYPNYFEAYGNRAVVYMQQKKYNKAMDDLKKAESIKPDDKNINYNFVALYSLQNQIDRAIDSLDKTLSLGFSDYDALRKDPDLNNVRKSPEFRKICEKHKVFIK